jgi:hemolysin III
MGKWSMSVRRKLRALDHSNIFVLIAGTYTPLCFNVLSGWARVALLVTIWALAAAGIVVALFAERIPRRVNTGLYISMGWVAIFALPAFLSRLPWAFVATLLLGGVLYTVGAVIYAQRRPNPFPRVFGFHEVFHLFVIAGSIAFAAAIWVWALPFPRI